jgi:hypothetical protein
MDSSAPEHDKAATPPPEIPPIEQEFGSTLDLYRYILNRLWVTGRFWLLPAIVVVFVLGFFLNLFTGLNVLPAIYSLVP